jgi:hypothetical protein
VSWPKWLSDIADDKLFQTISGLSGILGLAITLRVWWITNRISQTISANVRLPQLREQLVADLTQLNRLHIDDNASVHEIAVSLAICRSRLRSIHRYRSGMGPHRWVRMQISIARLAVLVGAGRRVVIPISHSIYGELQELVADIDDFIARIPLRSD